MNACLVELSEGVAIVQMLVRVLCIEFCSQNCAEGQREGLEEDLGDLSGGESVPGQKT